MTQLRPYAARYVGASAKYPMSYGPPTETTTTGLPVASSALVNACCPALPHALSVTATTSSLAFAEATVELISAGDGADPV